MDRNQLNELSEKIVLAVLSDSEEQIVSGLAKDLAFDDGWEKTVLRAASNAIKTSTVLSVQILLDILLGTGLFKISDEVTRPHLEVLLGGRFHER